ncbi:hypothetical protein QE152_g20732 [Popillia japonica]|uniref:Uncharacterized protein n=1 Tax=Popillia japonica TaxID=7064 RepID=A0AAW1KP36_POPJA
MIPNAYKILQLLGSATKVIIIIMFLLTSVSSSQSSCISKPVKPKTIFNELAHGYLGVRNGTVVITESKQTLYIVTVYMDPEAQRDHRKSSKFLIFDPAARRYICLMSKKKHRFVAKKYPKPEELCWFAEEDTSTHYQVRYVVEYDHNHYALKFFKNGKLMRPAHKSNPKSEVFMSSIESSDCNTATTKFCNNLSNKRHHKQSLTIRKICSRN